jgi:formylglycine-generating enzyme required for sulfatase activity
MLPRMARPDPRADANLRKRLARCYDTITLARMAAADAGLDLNTIRFDGPIEAIWFEILNEAGKHSPAGLYRLRANAHRDYPDHHPEPPPPDDPLAPSDDPHAPANTLTPAARDAIRRWLDARWSELRQVRLLGFTRHERVCLNLDDVIVTLHTRLIRRHPDRRPMAYDPDAEPAFGADSQVDLQGALTYMQANNARGLALVGDPGAGKTTLLRHLFCRVHAEGSAALGLPPDLIPVLIRCTDLQPQDLTPGGITDAIHRQLTHEKHPSAADALATGDLPLLVLLDGLDEVRDSHTRRAISQWLETEANRWPTFRFVITCRFVAWRDGARLSQPFIEAHIAWLSNEEVHAYVNRWYFAVIVGHDRGPPEEAAERAAALSALLLDPARLQRYRLRQMIQNPLLLATLCLVHRAVNHLPERRAELYNECIGFLLTTWATETRRPGLDNQTARQILQPLAYALHERQSTQEDTTGEDTRPLAIHRQDITALLAEPFRQTQGINLSLDDFLHRIRDDCGLFTGADEDRYEFLHLSFQEYLAAHHVIQTHRVAELADRIGEPFWREVILLALSEAGAYQPFMTRVVQTRRVAPHLELLREAFTVAPRIDPAPFLPALRRPAGLWSRFITHIRGGPDSAEVCAILSLFRDRPDPQLRAAARDWLDARDPGLAAAARTLIAQFTPITNPIVRGPTTVEWLRIPAGTFWMGSSDDPFHPAYDRDSQRDERPPRQATLTDDCWLSRHPVTNADYAAFLAAHPDHDPPGFWSDPTCNQPQQPVIGVSWPEARAFARWLGACTPLPIAGGCVDLPTEAEWERAARGSDRRRYPWGEAPPTAERADFDRSDGRPALVGTHPAGASPYGVEDLAGGVWEWCLDAWADSFADWPATVSDPCRRSGSPADARVVRGGSWLDWPRDLRAALRSMHHPRRRFRFVGFRVVCRVRSSTVEPFCL